jgi:hypothetical protein
LRKINFLNVFILNTLYPCIIIGTGKIQKNKGNDMVTKSSNENDDRGFQLKDVYCIIKNKEDGFYWVLNLEDHPNSFLLDRSYHQFIPPQHKMDQETMVVIQPTI